MISLLAAELALLSVGRRVGGRVRRDLGLSARQHLLRHDESDGAVQRDLAVSHMLARRAWSARLWRPITRISYPQYSSPIATVAHQAPNQESASPQLLAGSRS